MNGSARALAIVALLAGAAHAEPGYELRVPERIELVVGASGTLSIAIAVDRGEAIAKDAALIVDIAPDAAIAVKRRRLGRSDAVDPDADEPRFSVPLRADTAGDFTIKLHVRFWLCGTRACRPIDARRAVAVVAAPTPTP